MVCAERKKSTKMNKICETNPISETLKMSVNVAMTRTNNKKLRALNYSKRTQSNPILSRKPLLVFYRISDFFVDSGAAPLLSAHRTVISGRQFDNVDSFAGIVMHSSSGLRVEGFSDMFLPVEVEPRDTQISVALRCDFEAAGDVGGMGGDFRGDDACADIIWTGEAEVFSWRDIAEKGSAVKGGGGSADSGGDVVVAGRNIGYERPEDVEGGAAADFLLDFHIEFYLIEWDVARSFDHNLTAQFLRPGCQLTDGPEFRELCLVGGIGDAAGAKAVAEGKADVVFSHYAAQIVEHIIEGILPVVIQHPLCQQRPAPADYTADAGFEQRQVLFQNTCVNGKEIDALLGLFFDCLQDYLFSYVLDVSILYDLINRHCAERCGALRQKLPTGIIEVAAGAQVHNCVSAGFEGNFHFFDFRFHRRSNAACADIGVDFSTKRPADSDWLEVSFYMQLICRYYEVTSRYLSADNLSIEILIARYRFNLVGNFPRFCEL
jgi:hypothetical protein